MLKRFFAALLILGAITGLVFASLSTSDFVQHLDRQVHAIHCSFVPGAAPTTDATSGCHVALMSPWSSVLRTWVWGGLPVALPGMAVFAFLLFRAVEIWAVRGLRDRAAAGFLAVASLLPVLTSLFFGFIAITELGAICRTCAGIYTASAVTSLAAFGLLGAIWFEAPPQRDEETPEEEAPAPTADRPFEHPALLWLVGIGEGVGFVVLLAALYLLVAPDHGTYAGTCGTLSTTEDVSKVLVPIGSHRGGREAIEVFDPLCPACKGFERRLNASGLAEELDRKALLFPLDNTCNWMVSSAIHPGACAISEAILCADGNAQAVIDWAFDHQDEIRAAAATDAGAAAKMVESAFPAVKKCVGSAGARQKLNRALRFAVTNQLPVLTPQLYVDGQKLCDEDTDLGMDLALFRLLALPKGGSR